MKQEAKDILRNILFFMIGFIGFTLLWNFVLLPAIMK